MSQGKWRILRKRSEWLIIILWWIPIYQNPKPISSSLPLYTPQSSLILSRSLLCSFSLSPPQPENQTPLSSTTSLRCSAKLSLTPRRLIDLAPPLHHSYPLSSLPQHRWSLSTTAVLSRGLACALPSSKNPTSVACLWEEKRQLNEFIIKPDQNPYPQIERRVGFKLKPTVWIW